MRLAHVMTTDAGERKLVLEQLAVSEAQLLELIAGLTAAQWSFREMPERWSIAEVVEHVIVFEGFIREKIAEALAGPEEPEKRAHAASKEALVQGLAAARAIRFQAREATRPMGRWPEPMAMMDELRATRAKTLEFAEGCRADLRGHFFPHIVFGDLDCYQWLVVLGQHTARHALQIEEIQADPSYPAR